MVPAEHIASCILVLRGQKVMLDADLSELYGVATKALIQAVRRNPERFPQDFMFQTDISRSCKLEVTNCDLKFKQEDSLGRTPQPAVRILGARCGDAVFGAAQRALSQ